MSDRLPPEGWYEDPDGSGERYWDGAKWSTATRGGLNPAPRPSPPNAASSPADDEDAAPTAKKTGAVAGVAILMAVGIPFLLVGLGIRASFAIPDDWVVADALVTDIDVRDGCAAVASYEVAGTTYRVVGDIYSNPCNVDIGDPAPVFYNPNNPAQARLDDSLSKWFPLVFVGVGVLLSGIGAVALISRLRKRAHSGSG